MWDSLVYQSVVMHHEGTEEASMSNQQRRANQQEDRAAKIIRDGESYFADARARAREQVKERMREERRIRHA